MYTFCIFVYVYEAQSQRTVCILEADITLGVY